MILTGEFKYKGLSTVDAGTYPDKTTGKEISYDGFYHLWVDEIRDNRAIERKLRIELDNEILINKLRTLELFASIKLEVDLFFDYNNKPYKIVATKFIG